MTKVETGKIKRWFQKNIGLLGWKISIAVGDPPLKLSDDIRPKDRNEWYGRSVGNVPYHRGTIWVNSDAHSGDNCDGDETETLMHELLHLMFNDCEIDIESNQGEYFLNRMATVLAKQYRADSG